jgi:O-antigen/teichoic acid export membrane protein
MTKPETGGSARRGADASASARTVLIARAIGLLVTFLGSVALARALGPDGRGAQGFFVALVVLLVTLGGLGLPTGDYILSTRAFASREALARNAAWHALAVGFSATLVVVAVQAAVHVLPDELQRVPLWPLAMLVAATGFAYTAHQVQLGLASGRALLGAFLSFGIYAIAGVGYVAVLLVGGNLSAAIWIISVAPWLTLVVAAFARPRWTSISLGLPSMRLGGRTAGVGLRFYPGELAAMLLQRLDVVLLGILAPVSSVGMYVVAYQTAEPILVVASAAQATILALGLRTEDGDDSVDRLIRETFLLGAFLCVVAAVLAPIVIPVVYGRAFDSAVGPFLLLLPAVLVLAVGRIAAADLTRRNRLEDTVVASVVALIGNVVLNLLLIPPLGATGAAIASLASYTIFAVLSLAFLRRASGARWAMFVPRSTDLAALASTWHPRFVIGRKRSQVSDRDQPRDERPR